jgi:hypothetical protein
MKVLVLGIMLITFFALLLFSSPTSQIASEAPPAASEAAVCQAPEGE